MSRKNPYFILIINILYIVTSITLNASDFTPPFIQTVEEQTREAYRITGVGNLRALATSGKDIVWVGGTGGTIAKTEDGGQSWSLHPIPDGENPDVRALCVCNPEVICAMTVGLAEEGLSRVYRTVDGGTHWDLVLCPKTKGLFFTAMRFWDDKRGILLSDPVDGRFILFKTDNGGETWEELHPAQMPLATEEEAAFAASNSCLTVSGSETVRFGTGGGPFARVFYSFDQGRNWDVATTPMKVDNGSSGIFSLSFRDEHVGLAVGGDYRSPNSYPGPNILITVDGGKTWDILDHTSLAGKYLSGVTWVSDNRAIVVDGSQGVFHSVAVAEELTWAVGPEGTFTKFQPDAP